ncbi:flavoprotein-like protein [Aspergillus heterothallicus]
MANSSDCPAPPRGSQLSAHSQFSENEDDLEIRQKYRPFLEVDTSAATDWISDLELNTSFTSLRRRLYSRLVAFEASRILFRLGCDVRVFDPEGLPELRSLRAWSDGHVWISAGAAWEPYSDRCLQKQIDWIPLSTGSIRPTQDQTLAIGHVCSGSQSFNAVNSLRVLGRWMRMFTIPNQSSIPMAYIHFSDEGGNRDRLYTILMRPYIEALGD